MNPEYRKAAKRFKRLREHLLAEAAVKYSESDKFIQIVKNTVRHPKPVHTVDEFIENDTLQSLASQAEASRKPPVPSPELVFGLEKLRLLDPSAVKRIVQNVDMRDLVLFIKSASEPLKRLLLTDLSPRALACIHDEASFLGPLSARFIEEAGWRIIDTILKLESEGKIDTKHHFVSVVKTRQGFRHAEKISKSESGLKATEIRSRRIKKTNSPVPKLKRQTASPPVKPVKPAKKKA